MREAPSRLTGADRLRWRRPGAQTRDSIQHRCRRRGKKLKLIDHRGLGLRNAEGEISQEDTGFVAGEILIRFRGLPFKPGDLRFEQSMNSIQVWRGESGTARGHHAARVQLAGAGGAGPCRGASRRGWLKLSSHRQTQVSLQRGDSGTRVVEKESPASRLEASQCPFASPMYLFLALAMSFSFSL